MSTMASKASASASASLRTEDPTTTATWNEQPPPVLTHDFAIRSLRRRLWKAFQEDNGETALRAYQATKQDLEQWLEEEEQEQEQEGRLSQEQAQKKGASNKDKRKSFFLKLKSSKSSVAIGESTSTSTNNRFGSATSSNKLVPKLNVPGNSVTKRRISSSNKKQPGKNTMAEKNMGSAENDNVSSTKDLKPFENSVGPILQSQMNPSEPFIADDFLSPYAYESYELPARKELPNVELHERDLRLAKQRQKYKRGRNNSNHAIRRPRLPSFLFRKGNDDNNLDASLQSATLEQQETAEMEASDNAICREDVHMTTPLHEAARLGVGDFIRFLFANGGDPNMKNGQARTALHLTSGGFTAEEISLTPKQKKGRRQKGTKNDISNQNNNNSNQHPVGIRAPVIPPEGFALMEEESKKHVEQKGRARKAAKAVGRLFQSALRTHDKEPPATESSITVGNSKRRSNPARFNHLAAERMDAILAVLSWTQSETGEGPSINAVDTDGRTALHYAAELGRSDICTAILSNFGAMLTVVDELGSRTPCELASARGHADLAAQLEARAVLYIDPYGMDDELMASFLAGMDDDDGSRRNNLVTPFNWFDTMTDEQIAKERLDRMSMARTKMNKVIQQWDGGADMKKIMASAAKVGLRAALREDSDCEDASPPGDDANDGGGKKKSSSENEEEEEVTTSDMQDLMASAEKLGLNVVLGTEEEEEEEEGIVQPNDGAATKASHSDEDIASLSTDEDVDQMQPAFHNLQNAHVEQYLSYHHWNVSAAVKLFRKGPVDAFQKAGVPIPQRPPPATNEDKSEKIRRCLICYDEEVDTDDWVELSECIHGFCKECLHNYVKDCAASKMAVASISCPHHECKAALNQDDITSILSEHPDVLGHLAEANNEQFVSSAQDFRFCTHPGCPGVVKRVPHSFLARNGIDTDLLNYTGAVCSAYPSSEPLKPIGNGCTLTYEGVEDLEYTNCRSLDQPRKAHRFCFGCGEGRHWPVTCEQLEQWKEKMGEEITEVEEEGDGKNTNTVNELAQKLWIKANTRPCPQCNVPIEKNDGCNHMTCSNPSCRQEFCWICRKDWKLHGTSTGGFFRCNIWQEEGQEPPDGDEGRASTRDEETETDPTDLSNDQGYGTAIHSAREAWKQRQEMARFLHHYTRWEAHGESAALETNMGDSVCTRLAPVVEAAMDFQGTPTFNFGGKGLSFVHSAFTELLECRSVLKHSYAFSFFRYPTFYQFRRFGQLNDRRREKMTFERLQSELEILTENMSDIAARSHLRATQVQITFLTASAAEKREEFSNLMFSILNDERKEENASKTSKSNETHESRPNRRPRNATRHAPSPFGSLGRVHSDPFSSDIDQIEDEGLRSTLHEFMSRVMPHDAPEERNEDQGVRMWACEACTYMNASGHGCAMCGGLR